ncbi:MAG: hypothetical protein GW789_04055 [Ignavibacteria bacterium]|nr:hypothetical protein [Ignavibacteria bacterium]
MKNFGLMLNQDNDICQTGPINEPFSPKEFLSNNGSNQFTLIGRRKISPGVDAPKEVL